MGKVRQQNKKRAKERIEKLLGTDARLRSLTDIYTHEDVNVSESTFYEYFPPNSEFSEHLKIEISKRNIQSKRRVLDKWEDSDNPTLQIAYFKLIATDEERKKLSTNYNENKNENREIKPIQIKRITKEENKEE